MKYELTEENVIMITHAIDMELFRLYKLKSDAKSVKVFNDIYGDHIKALEETKRIFDK